MHSAAARPEIRSAIQARRFMVMTSPIPEGYPRVTPYLIVGDAAAAIDFYCTVLGASERMRMPMSDGRVGHAELDVGDSLIMLADENLDMDIRGPEAIGGTPVSLHVYVEDVPPQEMEKRAAAAAAG
jgi:PhnB protein